MGSVVLGMGMRRGCFRSDCQDVLRERVEEWVRRGVEEGLYRLWM